MSENEKGSTSESNLSNDPDDIGIVFVEGEFQRVIIDPDDIIVLSYPGSLNQEALRRLKESIQKQFPGHRIIILEEGMKLGVMAPTSNDRS